MYKFIIYVSLFFMSLFCKMYGQTNDSIQAETKDNYFIFKESTMMNNEKKAEIFQSKINRISNRLDKSIKENKEALKKDLLVIDKQLMNNEISQEEADDLKNEKAIFYANKIDEATLKSEKEINEALQAKVNNELDMKSSLNDYIKSLVEKRSYVLASLGFGTNLLLVDGKTRSDMYKHQLFSSLQFGIGGKTRLLKDNSHYYLRYELSSIINYVKPTHQRVLDVIDNETTLVEYEKPLKKSRIDFGESRISAYFEYDFSKKKEDEYGNVILRSRQSYFVGIGGFASYGNKKVTQIMKYETSGKEHKNREIGTFGINQFIYGVGGYIGYKNYSLFATYNLNSTFKNSQYKQNFLNIGFSLDIM